MIGSQFTVGLESTEAELGAAGVGVGIGVATLVGTTVLGAGAAAPPLAVGCVDSTGRTTVGKAAPTVTTAATLAAVTEEVVGAL
jgi:hypothetical protein